VDIASITPVAQDYLKAIWSATEWGGVPATGKTLAARFGTTTANASDVVKRLTAQGLLTHEPYRAIELTPAGERVAIAMVRKHRLIEAFLVTSLGYGWDEVHDEAEILEHAASSLLIERIDALLGYPRADPHGDPIPLASGETRHPVGAVVLTVAPVGPYIVERISDDDPGRLGYFAEVGLVPGADADVTAQDAHAHTTRLATAIRVDVTLGAPASAAVWVSPRP